MPIPAPVIPDGVSGAALDPALALALIGGAGIGAQWLAWRSRLPSILLLLLAGILVGPALGLIEPRSLFGEILDPLVSIAVGVILYEGGLSLRMNEFGAHGGPILRLLTIGVVVTWGLATILAVEVAGVPWQTAMVLGAILTVTGPTVIGPLLRQIRPQGPVEAIAKWEGIVVDVVGATLAVLVLQTITEGRADEGAAISASSALLTLLRTGLVGAGMGLAGTYAIAIPLRRHLVPDELENAVSLAVVLAVFVLSDHLAHESGLLAVTLMGFLLANRSDVSVHHIIEFKENLRVLLISTLFIVLAATIDLEALLNTGLRGLLFVALLILVVRSASVMLSMIGTRITLRERAFLAALAPRGIVAAAVSSLFALRLRDAGVPGAEQLAPLAFLVIVATVAVYGLGAGPLARRLGLSDPDAQGALIAGAGPFALALGEALRRLGFTVVHVDSNRDSVAQARLDGLPAHYGSILSAEVVEGLPLGGTGRFLGLTPNDEVNALASAHFAALYGRAEVYQAAADDARGDAVRRDLRGRVLFAPGMTIAHLDTLIRRGWSVKATPLTEEFDFDDLRALHEGEVVPLGAVEGARLELFTSSEEASAAPGHVLLSLAPSDEVPGERSIED
ncbi:MAG: sodium:proton antiporter [Planctomycetota bacterium]|nr:sodium:proton antiporter [Planctomycetota bacterium]